MESNKEKRSVPLWLLAIQLIGLIIVINIILNIIFVLLQIKPNFTLVIAMFLSSYLIGRYHAKNYRHISEKDFLVVFIGINSLVMTATVVKMYLDLEKLNLHATKPLIILGITAIVSIFGGYKMFKLGEKRGFGIFLDEMCDEVEEEERLAKLKKKKNKKPVTKNTYYEEIPRPKLEEKLASAGILIGDLIEVESIPKDERPEMDGVECNKSLTTTSGFEQLFGEKLFQNLEEILQDIDGIKFAAQEDRELFYLKSAVAKKKLQIAILNKLEIILRD